MDTCSADLETDTLFLGLTRPAMFLGVTQNFFVVNAMVSVMVFLASGSFVPFFLGAPLLHGLGVLACLNDSRTFDIWFVRAKFLLCRNRAHWGANSYAPFP